MVENAAFHKLDVTGIYFSKDGRLWFGTSEGLASFDGNDVKVYPVNDAQNKEIINDRIVAFGEDREGDIFLVTVQQKLTRFSAITGKYKNVDFLKNDSLKKQLGIAKLYFDRDHKLWLATNRGFFIYDIHADKYEHYNLQPSNPASWTERYSNTVYDIKEDRHDPDKIWIASHGLGILSFNKKTKIISRKFTALNATDSVQQDSHLTQFEIGDSLIWFGTWSAGMGKYNMATGKYTMYPRNGKMYVGVYPHGHVIRRIVRKSDHEFYVAIGDSLPAVFNTQTGRYSYINNYPLQQTVNRTTYIEKDKDGNVWCLKGGRLYLASPRFALFKTLEVTLHQPRPFPPANILRKMIWDDKQQLYYGAVDLGEGIYVYDKDLHYLKTITLPEVRVHEYTSDAKEFEIDRTGRLWVMGDSLYVYDSSSKKMVAAIEKYKGLPLFRQTFRAITTDATGNLILQTNKRTLIFLDVVTFTFRTVSLPEIKNKPAIDFNPRNLLFDKQRNYLYGCDGGAIFQYGVVENSLKINEANLAGNK